MLYEFFKLFPQEKTLYGNNKMKQKSYHHYKNMVQEHITVQTGKLVLLKDLTNLMRRSNNDTHNNLEKSIKNVN